MVSYRTLLLLLLLLAVSEINTKKTHDVIKKIGKRYKASEYWSSVFWATVQNLKFWKYVSEEEVNAQRIETARLVAYHFMMQSSSENKIWSISANIIESMLDTIDFQGGVCGARDMNHYQYIKYLKWERELMGKTGRQQAKFHHLPMFDYQYNNFIVTFSGKQKKWNTVSERAFIVQMQLMKESQWSNYTITRILEVGGCTEKGISNLYKTNVYENLFETDPDKIRRRDYLMQQVVDVFDTGKVEADIPFKWIQLTAPETMFDGKVCHGDKLVDYGRQELFAWWRKFQLMYHPSMKKVWTQDRGSPNAPWIPSIPQVRVNLIGGEKDRYVFRITLIVQYGRWNTTRDPIEKDFKIQMKYFKEDGLWFVDKFEVMCKPLPENLMAQHLDAYREMIDARLNRLLINPVLWYTSINTLSELLSPNGTEIENCGHDGSKMERTTDIRALENKFWEENESTAGEMKGIDVGNELNVGRAKPKTWVQIYIIWTPLRENEVHESRWTFELEWNDRLQYYSIYKMRFECPSRGEGRKSYNSLRRSKPKPYGG